MCKHKKKSSRCGKFSLELRTYDRIYCRNPAQLCGMGERYAVMELRSNVSCTKLISFCGREVNLKTVKIQGP